MQRAKKKLHVDTFPFLAVLLCAMGSLILLLMVMDRRAKAVAKHKLAAELEARQQARTEERHKDRSVQLVQIIAQRQAEFEKQRDKLHQTLVAQEQELRSQLAGMAREADGATKKLEEKQSEFVTLQQKLAREYQRLLQERQDLAQKTTTDLGTEDKKAALVKGQMQRLTLELLQLERALLDLKELKSRPGDAFSLVPYRGKQGDNRKPVYVECYADGMVMHPGRTLIGRGGLTVEQFRQEIQRRAGLLEREQERDPRAHAPPPTNPNAYVLFLVRPEGIETYYLAQNALRGYAIDYGYELVESTWVFDFANEDSVAQQPWHNDGRGPGKNRPLFPVTGSGPMSFSASGLVGPPGSGYGSGPPGSGPSGSGMPGSGIPGNGPGGPPGYAGSGTSTSGLFGPPGSAMTRPGTQGTGGPGSAFGGPPGSGSGVSGTPGPGGVRTTGTSFGGPGSGSGVPGAAAFNGPPGSGGGVPGTTGFNGPPGSATSMPGAMSFNGPPGTGTGIPTLGPLEPSYPGGGPPGQRGTGLASPGLATANGLSGGGLPGSGPPGTGIGGSGTGIPGSGSPNPNSGAPGVTGTGIPGSGSFPGTGAPGSGAPGTGIPQVAYGSGSTTSGLPPGSIAVDPTSPNFNGNASTRTGTDTTTQFANGNQAPGSPGQTGAPGSGAKPGYSTWSPGSVSAMGMTGQTGSPGPQPGVTQNALFPQSPAKPADPTQLAQAQGAAAPRGFGVPSVGGPAAGASGNPADAPGDPLRAPGQYAGNSGAGGGGSPGSGFSSGGGGSPGGGSPGGGSEGGLPSSPTNIGSVPAAAPGAGGAPGKTAPGAAMPENVVQGGSPGSNIFGGGMSAPAKNAKPAPAPFGRLISNHDYVITLECLADGVMIYPNYELYPIHPVENQKNVEQTLVRTIQQMIARRQASVRPGEPAYRPMIHLQVEPEGARTYYWIYPTLQELHVPMYRENLEN